MKWNRSQLDKAVGLRAGVDVAVEMLSRARARAELSAAMFDKLAPMLIAMGEEAGLVLARPDLVLTDVGDGASPFTTRFVVRWHPESRPCRLIGGPNDGQQVQFDVWANWTMAEIRMPGLPQFPTFETATAAEHTPPVYQYVLDGWDEETRTWLMTFKAER